MKKPMVILLVILQILLLASCGKTAEELTESASSSSETMTYQPSTSSPTVQTSVESGL